MNDSVITDCKKCGAWHTLPSEFWGAGGAGKSCSCNKKPPTPPYSTLETEEAWQEVMEHLIDRHQVHMNNRKIELWYKHMRGEQLTEEEIKEYGLLTGVLTS